MKMILFLVHLIFLSPSEQWVAKPFTEGVRLQVFLKTGVKVFLDKRNQKNSWESHWYMLPKVNRANLWGSWLSAVGQKWCLPTAGNGNSHLCCVGRNSNGMREQLIFGPHLSIRAAALECLSLLHLPSYGLLFLYIFFLKSNMSAAVAMSCPGSYFLIFWAKSESVCNSKCVVLWKLIG